MVNLDCLSDCVTRTEVSQGGPQRETLDSGFGMLLQKRVLGHTEAIEQKALMMMVLDISSAHGSFFHVFFFFFFASLVLEFELRALCLLGR
jgi:hypothetical protein